MNTPCKDLCTSETLPVVTRLWHNSLPPITGRIRPKEYCSQTVSSGTVSPTHNPPETYRFNKLREAGGSIRLTLVKAALETADVDPRPPRPLFAHIPAGDGVWLAFDVEQYESQQTRVRARSALTAKIPGDSHVVGEYPISLRGKLGSGVTIVPKRLADTVGVTVGDDVTTIAVGPGVLLFVAEQQVSALDVGSTLEAIRETLPE